MKTLATLALCSLITAVSSSAAPPRLGHHGGNNVPAQPGTNNTDTPSGPNVPAAPIPGPGGTGGTNTDGGFGNGNGNGGFGGGGFVNGRSRGFDNSFIRQSAQMALMEIAAGEAALSNSQDSAIQELAQQLVTDHSAQLEQAQALAADAGFTLPGALATRDAKSLSRLPSEGGASFDRAWTQLMVSSHSSAFALHERAATRASQAATRAYARAQLVPLAAHLTMALDLYEQLRTGGTTNTNTPPGTNTTATAVPATPVQ